MAHKKFRLIVIGDEILSGKRQDKHMSKIIELLNERGLSLHQAEYVGDDRAAIIEALKKSFASDDVVFITGGIGSTPDDHTRQCAAAALNVPLALHPEAKELIIQRIHAITEGDAEKTKLSNPENVLRLKMGEFPLGSDIIPNSYNLIPGFRIKEHHFFPGFPVMAAPMMAWVLDELYAELFHLTDFVEKSFIVPLGAEATLTILMEQIEAAHSGVRVFSLPSVGDPRKGGVFAKRHIELGVKGSLALVDKAFPFLREGVLKLGFEIHDLPQTGD